jgi:nucleoid-associated protein YgaU
VPAAGSDKQVATLPVEEMPEAGTNDKRDNEMRDVQIPTVTFEAAAPKSTPVIIRRGDSLWRISQRVYGQGVRYTTIYLANRDQIRDPNKIYPGQVFGVPDDENADSSGNEVLQAN